MSLRPLLRCLPFAAIALAAACSERLDTSKNCPVLCTDNSLAFRDTTFDVVEFDSMYAGFTGVGERWRAPGLATSDGLGGYLYETFVPVVSRPDSVDIRQVFRFDTLPRTLSATDTTSIAAVTDSKLLLVIDTARSVIPAGNTTVSLYDVDDSTVTDDTSAAVLAARFVPSRLIATRTFTRDEVYADTIDGSGSGVTIRSFQVSIPDSIMLRLVTKAHRIRVGMQVTSAGPAGLRFVAPSVNSSNLVPRVTYDPSPDTTVDSWLVSTQYNGTAASPERLRSQTLVLQDRTTLLNDGSLEVGGMVGSRSLLKVRIPRGFLDTVTIVRASLDLVQRPRRTMPGAGDFIRIRARVGIAGPALGSDPRRLVEFLDPTLEGVLLPSLRIAAADSGTRSFDVGAAIRLWIAQDTVIPTSFVLYSEGETFQEQRPAFFSSRATIPSLRPRLRVTYTTRREGAIP
ncbi:MAG: hypothetical protein IT355_07345 [Gemmatimonadaceae bacterium]|nr:hypothetical protein [Gemmatimonadaceae bacterium]